jgi:hypothetical protein
MLCRCSASSLSSAQSSDSISRKSRTLRGDSLSQATKRISSPGLAWRMVSTQPDAWTA